MSAYIVPKNTILFLTLAALSRRIACHGVTWFHNETSHTIRQCDYERAAEVANLLWRENISSVSARYPNESSATLPGSPAGKAVITRRDMATVFDEFDPVRVLACCDCYEYQSCEHEGWHTSEAKAFLEGLRSSAICALPGYGECGRGAPEPNRGAVSLSALMMR